MQLNNHVKRVFITVKGMEEKHHDKKELAQKRTTAYNATIVTGTADKTANNRFINKCLCVIQLQRDPTMGISVGEITIGVDKIMKVL